MAKQTQSAAPLTTAQQLGSLIKSARDIMRKDKGLNGDLDRLPMLTWIMFLKFLDDLEQIRETDAKLAGKRFRHTIEPPYRWRDWAAKPDGITGDELIAFVNNEEARGPDGKKGPGLFAYLRSLQGANGGDRRDVIATVFKGTVNRMINGYLLRDVVNKVHGIHFTSSGEIHTLGHLYESMLKEMRDAAGDSGEFYTPRAVVRFMVAVTDPRLGETLLDPACGTGGFLVESFEHLRKQCKRAEHYAVLQSESLLGGEAKPLPYLLAQMNLLLHGLETPKIDPLNSLRVALKEIGDRDRVDIILTNPPFGGEEERGILSNFPEDKQTSETALLFLQLIMRKLRRRRARAPKPQAERASSSPTAPSSAMASVPASRKNCSRTSISTPSSACPTASLLPTRAFRRISSSSTAPVPRKMSGTTSSRCPKAGRTTPRPSRFSSKNLPTASPGGTSEKRTTAPGKSPPPTFSRTAAISTSRTRAAKWTSSIFRRSNSPTTS